MIATSAVMILGSSVSSCCNILTFVKAFAVWYPMPEPFEHDFLVIFTEHHGWHWYDPEDLNAWYQFAGEHEPAETIEIEPRKDE